MVQDTLTSMVRGSSREELLSRVVQFTHRLEFETVTLMVVADRPCGASEFASIDNAPAPFNESLEYTQGGECDPVMQHCKKLSLPIVWDQDTYVAADKAREWEHQAQFGYRNGIAVAIHLPDRRHLFLGVDRRQPMPSNARKVMRMVAELQLFAVCAIDAAMTVLQRRVADVDVPRLTPRELECLRWTMEGKTSWEVGRILGISEQTAVKHTNNATHKLGCVSKVQAVAKAFRLGLIQ
jgi:DNA-binding CsgD family transcriptional regulator